MNSYDADCGVTSVAFSASGKYFFTSYSMGHNVKVWDTLHGKMITELKGHKERVSSIGISGDGRALGTACWDRTLKVISNLFYFCYKCETEFGFNPFLLFLNRSLHKPFGYELYC